MKKYTGKAKVKEDTTWIYAGHTLDIIGFREEKNGSGQGVIADGARQYVLSLEGTDFKYSCTHIYCHDLEVLELFEEIILPLTDDETLELVGYCRDLRFTKSDAEILEDFLKRSHKASELSTPDLSTLYTEEEWTLRTQTNS